MTTTELSALNDLDDVIRSEMDRRSVPGIALGLMFDGQCATAGYGVANVDTGFAVLPETLFQIGSISKIFTTTLVMSLVDEGLLELEAPVIRYVPTLPLADREARESITIRHLVTHLGGFYGDRFDDQGNGDDALARAVAAFADLPQQTKPGEMWTYCNAGFDLAGRAVELVTGKPFEVAMRERVFEPLGLSTATYFAAEAILHAVSTGHIPTSDDDAKPRVARPWPIPRRSGPAGGVSAQTSELLRFAAMHICEGDLDGRRVISAASATAMQTPQTAADAGRTWGLGWSLRSVNDVAIIEHNGATNGFTARLTIVPSRNFAIAILTNSGSGSAAHTAISKVALDELLGLRETEPKLIDLPEATLKRFSGRYHQNLEDLELTVDDGDFAVERTIHSPFSGLSTRGNPFRLRPISETIFRAEGGGQDGNLAEFILFPDGALRFLRFGGRLSVRL